MTPTNRIQKTNETSLLVETQFATDLILDGLRRLVFVPTDPEMAQWGSNDRNYALHVGMYNYAAGLERLCKLTISCNEYLATGEFPPLKQYSHRIQKMLDAVETSLPPSTGPGRAPQPGKYLVRPSDILGPGLMEMVERFAGGLGRYEHLDSLSKEDIEVRSYNDWSALAEKAPVSEEICNLIATKRAIADIFESEMTAAGLEATMRSLMEDLSIPLDERSVGVVLSLFRTVRWVAATLNLASYYTSQEIPLLGEVVSRKFIQPSEDFFRYQIVGIQDQEVVNEELTEAYTRVNQRDAELDSED